MTTKARIEEANRASTAFHLAMTLEGVNASVEALKLWQDYPQVPNATATASWLSRVVAVVMGRRRKARQLGRAYYRYVRALWTDRTIPALEDDGEPETTLSELRQDFVEQLPVQAARQLEKPAQKPAQSDSEPSEDDDKEDDEDRILIEEIEHLKELEEESERLAEEELRRDLASLGPHVLEKKLKDIDLNEPASVVDEMRRKAHAEAGARQAATAARVTMNGARNDIHDTVDADKRAIGYIRVSKTGEPCGWCAMLISRGPVYKSKQSAEFSDGQKYHDNDQCTSFPVFSKQDYETNPRYAQNRQYQAEWPVVTKGLSGKAAVSAWRRYIRLSQRPAVQEAA